MKMRVGEAQVNQIRCQEQHDDAQKNLDKLHNGFIFFVMGHLFKARRPGPGHDHKDTVPQGKEQQQEPPSQQIAFFRHHGQKHHQHGQGAVRSKKASQHSGGKGPGIAFPHALRVGQRIRNNINDSKHMQRHEHRNRRQ